MFCNALKTASHPMFQEQIDSGFMCDTRFL